jgi:regulator of protease activity HflC (stomatin/prohibitin superfamily)
MEENNEKETAVFWLILILFGLGLLAGLMFAFPWYGRYQTRADARNQVQVNEIKIKQQEQLIQVEKQKAEIRIVEAGGISEAQKIINATLTDKYLQHEAIQAQEKMADSPNHTTIYIPSGQNGIPLVKTLE